MICPFATQRPGPATSINPFARAGLGLVMHSAEGSLEGAFGQLANSGLSWHFTNDLDGTLYQHYDTTVQCLHAHAAGNVHYIGVEHINHYTDGVPDHQPFTAAQVATDIKLIQWLAQNENWPGFVRQQTLWEHHEVAGNATSCPDGRVPWKDIFAALQPPTKVPAGLGVRYSDGSDAEVWTPNPGKTIVGIGLRFSDGSIDNLWHA